MKNKIVQLTHRFPALEYVFSTAAFFIGALLVVLLLVFLCGLLTGT